MFSGNGGKGPDLKQIKLVDAEPEKIYTFSYRALHPGRSDGYYDARPLIMILSADTSGILGLNTHYLESTPDKAGFIFSFRKGEKISKAIYEVMIHRYRYDRIRSGIFEVINFTVDARVMATSAI